MNSYAVRRHERRPVSGKVPRRLALLVSLVLAPSAAYSGSTCFGTPENGALRDGCRLPEVGENFSAYSALGVAAGRTYSHCVVAAVVRDAFNDLAQSRPDLHFVIGESGFSTGGVFKPHKSHQNGLSVDFFVPVRDRRGRSVALPTTSVNRWGYDLEFDSQGKSEDLTIDFDAIALHLSALERAAKAHNISIRRVFFDTKLQNHLRTSEYWGEVRSLSFSTRQGWWRHDEHYHVDFKVPCQRLRRP